MNLPGFALIPKTDASPALNGSRTRVTLDWFSASGSTQNASGARKLMQAAALWIVVSYVAFCPGSAAFGQVMHVDFTALDPAMQEKVQSALVKVKESPDDIAAVETLLAVEPRVVKTVGTSESFSSNDPVRSRALKWSQSFQP